MKSNLELVLAASGGKLFLSLTEVAQLTGWSVKTLRNRPEGFPVPLSRMGGRVGVPAVKLAAFLDELAGVVEDAPPQQNKSGRPRKAVQQVREGDEA
jgi:hypothetical protein